MIEPDVGSILIRRSTIARPMLRCHSLFPIKSDDTTWVGAGHFRSELSILATVKELVVGMFDRSGGIDQTDDA